MIRLHIVAFSSQLPSSAESSLGAQGLWSGLAAAALCCVSGPQIADRYYLNRRIFSDAIRQSREHTGCEVFPAWQDFHKGFGFYYL